MAQEVVVAKPQHSNAYNIFILVLTVFSIALMVVMLLPVLTQQTLDLLIVYDNVICVIFLIDFFTALRAAPSKRHFFINERGWLDLIGSIPTFGVFRFTALLRLARLSRFARIARLLQGENKAALVKDIVEHRGQYAMFITILATLIVLTIASAMVLEFETSAPPEANASITSGGDALWYSIVTITTVGYGDFYPVTTGGRITAFFIMIAGVGIIGALASILASLLVPPPPKEEEPDPSTPVVLTVQQELAEVKGQLEPTVMSIAPSSTCANQPSRKISPPVRPARVFEACAVRMMP
jgi:voltage-gated potassium channel